MEFFVSDQWWFARLEVETCQTQTTTNRLITPYGCAVGIVKYCLINITAKSFVM